MFGYIVCLVFLVVGCITGNDRCWFIASLFAIAGSLSFCSYAINNLKSIFEEEDEPHE